MSQQAPNPNARPIEKFDKLMAALDKVDPQKINSFNEKQFRDVQKENITLETIFHVIYAIRAFGREELQKIKIEQKNIPFSFKLIMKIVGMEFESNYQDFPSTNCEFNFFCTNDKMRYPDIIGGDLDDKEFEELWTPQNIRDFASNVLAILTGRCLNQELNGSKEIIEKSIKFCQLLLVSERLRSEKTLTISYIAFRVLLAFDPQKDNEALKNFFKQMFPRDSNQQSILIFPSPGAAKQIPKMLTNDYLHKQMEDLLKLTESHPDAEQMSQQYIWELLIIHNMWFILDVSGGEPFDEKYFPNYKPKDKKI